MDDYFYFLSTKFQEICHAATESQSVVPGKFVFTGEEKKNTDTMLYLLQQPIPDFFSTVYPEYIGLTSRTPG